MIYHQKTNANDKGVNRVAKTDSCQGNVAPELLYGSGKPSIESDISALTFWIRSVYLLLIKVEKCADCREKCHGMVSF